ncbi:MAG: YHS domain-containing protein [Candidatus Electrothrix sp. AR1]|nr:YHS domain-containing protein [Candidatus Electrothrix sp. AR1]
MLLSFAGNVFAAAQTTCPVMGGKINKEIYADHDGKRVYFCCAACISTFNEDPEKYLAKLQEAGVEPEAIPADDAAPTENMDHTDHEGHSGHAK